MTRRHRELGLRRGRGCAESLYSMINLNRLQDGRLLRLTHPALSRAVQPSPVAKWPELPQAADRNA
jgi:hypothetical protein